MRPVVILLFALLQTAPLSQQTGTIRGTLMRSGSLEPVADAQISLSPAAAFQAFETVMNASTTMSLPIQQQIPQYLSLSAEELQMTIRSINRQSMPADFLDALNRLVETRAASPGFPKTLVTDGSGHFTFTDVPPGQYALMAQRDGFFGLPDDGSNRPRFYARVFATVSGASGADVRVALTPGGLITGRVRDANGQPVTNVTVSALGTIYQGGLPVLQAAVSNGTDDRGEYRLYWLNPGEYLVAVMPRVLPPGITTSLNTPVRTFYPSVSDVTQATAVSVKIGDEVTGIDLTPRTTPTVKISGQILNQLGALPPNPDGTVPPPPVATLILLQRNVGVPDDAGGNRVIGNVQLNPNTGSFEIPGIRPGVYDLYTRINHPGGSLGQAGATNAWGRLPIEILDRDLEGITLVIHGSVEVKGSVTVDGGIARDAKFRVGLQPEGSSQKLPNYQGVLGRAQTPSADGSISIPGVSEGPYRIVATGLTEDLYIEDVRQTGGSVFDMGIFVGDRTPDPIQVSIKTNGGRLNGVVLGASSKPAPLSTVVLIPNAEQRRNAALYKVVTADLAGQFSIRGIRPGGYKIFAWDNVPPSAYQNAAFLSKDEARGRTVTVTPSSSASVEVSLISRGN